MTRYLTRDKVTATHLDVFVVYLGLQLPNIFGFEMGTQSNNYNNTEIIR